MGLFFTDKPKHVSPEEFKKVRNELADHDFTEKERDAVESFFATSMYETREQDQGIDANEIQEGLNILRENYNVYHLSPQKLDILEQKLKKYL